MPIGQAPGSETAARTPLPAGVGASPSAAGRLDRPCERLDDLAGELVRAHRGRPHRVPLDRELDDARSLPWPLVVVRLGGA